MPAFRCRCACTKPKAELQGEHPTLNAVLALQASEFVLESALGLIGTVSLWKSCRERMADMGVIHQLILLAKDGKTGACSALCNLSRSDSLLTTLRDEGLVEAMQSYAERVQEMDAPEMTKVGCFVREERADTSVSTRCTDSTIQV